jgi:hypothetical protein
MEGLENRRRVRCLLLAGMLCLAAASGCTTGGSSGEPYAAGDDSVEPSINDYEEGGPPPAQYDAAPPRYDDAPPPVVVEEKERPLVPETARLRVEGRGDITFKAPRDGFVYVVDSRDRKLVYEGPLDEGETLLVAPYRNQIEVDGQRVKRVKDLDNKHIHRIFFEREGSRGRGGGRD